MLVVKWLSSNSAVCSSHHFPHVICNRSMIQHLLHNMTYTWNDEKTQGEIVQTVCSPAPVDALGKITLQKGGIPPRFLLLLEICTHCTVGITCSVEMRDLFSECCKKGNFYPARQKQLLPQATVQDVQIEKSFSCVSACKSKIPILVLLFPCNTFRKAICILAPSLVTCCSESVHSDVVEESLSFLFTCIYGFCNASGASGFGLEFENTHLHMLSLIHPQLWDPSFPAYFDCDYPCC